MGEVRSCIRFFFRAPSLIDELATYAQEEGVDLKLVIDVKTRWNSTLRMLRNFLGLKTALMKFFARPGRKERFPLKPEEVIAITDMVRALEHVETATKRLPLANATLRSADLALQVSNHVFHYICK